jgi:8-oxo-dGTP pyrophosphatase MutT (NUDIX family)
MLTGAAVGAVEHERSTPVSIFGKPVEGGSGPSAARDASTVVIARDAAGGPELLMVRRKKGSSFMADAFVFPGGRVDDNDASAHPLAGEEAIAKESRVAAIADDAARALTLAVAGIREVFEEAGILIAVADGKPIATDGDPWFRRAQEAVHQGQRGFREVLAERDLSLAVSELAFFARWVTPVSEPRRFDARFFLARMPSGQTAVHNAEELVEQRWATPRAILDDYAAGKLKLPPPTIWHLTDLAKHATVEAALAWARAVPVVTVRPKLCAIEGAPAIVLPWDSEYQGFPGDTFPIGRDHPIAGEVTRYVLDDGRWSARTV